MSDDLHQTSSGKRLDVISWDEFFMSVAIAAQRAARTPTRRWVRASPTPTTASFRWATTVHPRRSTTTFSRGVRATTRCRTSTTTWSMPRPNAVLNYRGSLKDLEGSTVYVTLSRATTAPRFWLRWAWARSSTWTTSTPTPMTDASAAASSTPVASATARLSSMSRLVPGDRLDSNMRCRYLTTNAAQRAPSQIDYS